MLLNEYPHINDPPKQVPCNYVECVCVCDCWRCWREKREGGAGNNECGEKGGRMGRRGAQTLRPVGVVGIERDPGLRTFGVKLKRAVCLRRDPVGLTQ